MKMLKKVLAVVLAATTILATVAMPVSASVSTFADVSADDWFAAAVERWAEAEVLVGDGNGNFNPNAPITRAEMATVMNEVLGLTALEEYVIAPKFSDVKEGDWFYHKVMRIAEEQIIFGMGDGTYKPNASITREAACRIIAGAVQISWDAPEEVYEATMGHFDDYADISDWAKGCVAPFVQMGVIVGDDQDNDGKAEFRPQDVITRAEVATILNRLIGTYVDKDGDISFSTSRNDNAGLVVVNLGQSDDWTFNYTVDEEGAAVVSATNLTTGEVKTEKFYATTEDGFGDDFADLVVGTEKKSVDEKDDACVNGEEDSIADDHEGLVKCTDCAVGFTPVIECEVCGTVELEYHDAHPHSFDLETEEGIACSCCGKLQDDSIKFRAKVTSNEEYVEVKVSNDYAAELVITPGNVDAGNVNIEVEMNDVASLGGGNKYHSQDFNTGLTGNPELSVWLSNAFTFESGTVEATIQDKEVTYELEGSELSSGAAKITATPADVEATREAWQELTSHVSTATQEASDSKIVIANGSYMIVDNDKLCFEKGKEVGDLVLDGFASDFSQLEDQIRAKVQLNTVPVDPEYQAQFYLAAGTQLAVSNSIATLDDNCLIKFSGSGLNTADFQNVLTDLQAAEGGYAMASELVQMLNAMIASADGEVIKVDITFEEAVEKDTKFYLGVTADNADGSGKTTVDMEVFDDYSLEINLPMNEISAANVTLEARMKNVGSLDVDGERKHEQTISTGMTATGDLAYWMRNAAAFDSASITAVVGDLSCTYDLVSDHDADWVTVTGTTNTEEARAVWAELTDHVSTRTQDASDSYIFLGAGSYVDTTTEKLCFEGEAVEAGLKLDNFSNLSDLKAHIKANVTLVEGSADAITLFVGEGTELAVSNSVATLNDDCTITITGMDLSDDVLAQIRTASDEGNEALVKALFNVLNDFVGAANGKDVTVVFNFDCDCE